MKICRECKWWERSQRFWGGLCSKLGVGHEKIIRWDEKEDDAGITRHPYTFENFSCMHFEKKSKESDVLFHYAWVEQSKWIIYYRSDQNDALPVYITREYDALQACNWLNKHWQQRNETDE